MNKYIEIFKAKEHNLKNIDLKIPKNKLVVITGVSGSGKSSLAFDTIYTEGKRRYTESLSSYARQFLGVSEKPNVEKIEGLSPAISIDQKNSNYNPRSTVGTITEIYDYLRVMFSRVGIPYCVNGHGSIKTQTKLQIEKKIINAFDNKTIMLLSPIITRKKGTHQNIFLKLKQEGFLRVNVDKQIYTLDNDISLEKNKFHTIEIVLDRFLLTQDNDTVLRLSETIEAAMKYSNGLIIVEDIKTKHREIYSENYSCLKCMYVIPELEPRLFSFNSPIGYCEECQGLGVIFGVNPNLLFDYNKSILDGGIEYYKNLVNTFNMVWQEFKILCEHYKISLKKPISELTKKEINIILNGSLELIKYHLINPSSNNEYKKYAYIEGTGKKIERLYNETTSESARIYYKSFMSEKNCQSCQGSRLNKIAMSILINNKNIYDLCEISIEKLYDFINNLKFSQYEKDILENLLIELKQRISFLLEVGLNYLTFSRSSNSLSGGEYQRIRLATQIGSRLTGVLYVLDEPSIGLHQKDNAKLIKILKAIRDLGNTIIVVEHDEEIMLESDYIIDIGPGAGINGGHVVNMGIPDKFIKHKSLTAKFLNGQETIAWAQRNRKLNFKHKLSIVGARENNLRNINVDIPLNALVCVTGVSGSGKSSLINTILSNGLKKEFGNKVNYVGKYSQIKHDDKIDKVVTITQQPIGKTSRSNPATYVGVFGDIRELFAKTLEAQARGYKPGKFSFNVTSGRCYKCQGSGSLRISMLFMADVNVICDECEGKRYKKEVLQIYFKDKNINDVLEMTVDEALDFFKNQARIYKKLKIMQKVGLNYIKLNQPAPHLSGGEAQRVKLAYYLLKKSTGKTVYILDEPTTGLHFSDIKKLIKVFIEMVDQKNSLIIIEHNLDIIKIADYIIDLGPGAGEYGGKVVGKGTPMQLMDCDSHTGKYLKLKYNLDNSRK